jgi:hypothetical protein
MILTYNDQEIQQRDTDGYVNLTQMAKANNVEVSNWLRLDSATVYIQALESDLHISASELIIVKKGGISKQQGTWAHPLLALNFGRWINPLFAIWCDKHIKTLLETGKTQLKIKELPTTVEYVNAIEKIPNLRCSEALKQVLLDKMGDELCTQLNSTERWIGVAQKAEEMGLAVNHHNRSTLGKFIKSQGLNYRTETRLCNGQLREILVYQDSEDLENAICLYFS